MEIFVSAGEASSDLHAAHLLRELKKRIPSLTSFGLGGDALASEGTQLLLHCREFSVGGGPVEILRKLPLRSKFERILEDRLSTKRPDLAILVDSGEVNLRLAQLLNFFEVPVVYFIPPKVWAWRASRIEKIAQHVKLVLCILPFEENIFKECEIPVRYVGHPVSDEIPKDFSEKDARKILGISDDVPILTVMPGSRHGEIHRHAQIFSKAIEEFFAKLPADQPKPRVVVPVAPSMSEKELQQLFGEKIPGVQFLSSKGLPEKLSPGVVCLKASRAALVKSGTSTLEAAVLGVPMVLAYQVAPSSIWIYRHIVRYRGFVGMVNLFLAKSYERALGWEPLETPVVPELVLEKCQPTAIANALFNAYVDGPYRTEMLKEFSRAKTLILPPRGLGESPSSAAAEAIFQMISPAGRKSA